MKHLFYILFFLTTQSLAQQHNCQGVDSSFNQAAAYVKRSCSRSNECKVDVLDWSACGKPVAHSDSERVQEMLKQRAELHRMCKYVVAPCAAIPGEAMCLGQVCQLKQDFLGKEQIVTVTFYQVDKLLVKAKITLDADNGIRCESAPCPSRTVLREYVTNEKGQISIKLNDLLGPEKQIPSDGTPTLRRGDVRLENIRFRYEDQGFYTWDLPSFLASQKSPYMFDVKFN